MGLFPPFLLIILTVAAISRSVYWPPLVAIPFFLLCRGFFIGLLDVIRCPKRHMDIIVEERGLGYMADGKRWYMTLSGISLIRKGCSDVWTMLHDNGSVINIPIEAISTEQVECLKTVCHREREEMFRSLDKYRKKK